MSLIVRGKMGDEEKRGGGEKPKIKKVKRKGKGRENF